MTPETPSHLQRFLDAHPLYVLISRKSTPGSGPVLTWHSIYNELNQVIISAPTIMELNRLVFIAQHRRLCGEFGLSSERFDQLSVQFILECLQADKDKLVLRRKPKGKHDSRRPGMLADK